MSFNIDFKENPSIFEVLNPQFHIDEYSAMADGQFNITPNTIFSHMLSTSIGGVAGYRLTHWAIGRGLPIGPLMPWKDLKNAVHYRTYTTPIRWGSRAARFVASRAFLPVAFLSLVAYTGMNEPSRTDTSLNILYNPIEGRHYGNPIFPYGG